MRPAAIDFARERAALRETLAEVGPDAPTSCGTWTTTDLAVHIALGEMLAGLPNAPLRVLVGQGVRLDRMAPVNKRLLDGYRQRFGFEWAKRRLGRKAPRVQCSRAVGPVSLLEVWAHHEDVVAANGRGCRSDIDLSPAVRVLVRYQRRVLREHRVRLTSSGTVWHEPGEVRAHIDGEIDDVARWLAGRGSLSVMTTTGEAQVVSALAAATLQI